MENKENKKVEFEAPENKNAEATQQVETTKKPWYKKWWGKALIAAGVVGVGVGTTVVIKKCRKSTTANNAVEVEEETTKDVQAPRENRDRGFGDRRREFNKHQQ